MPIPRLYRLLTFFITMSFGYITYRVYAFDEGLRALHFDILAGTATAPWQYRFLPHLLANFLERFGIRFYQTFALVDIVALWAALWLFGRNWLHPTASRQPLYLFTLIVVLQYWLLWAVYWHQVPYTLPSLLYVALVAQLFDRDRRGTSLLLIGPASLLLTAVQTTIRADIAFAVGAGYAIHDASKRNWMRAAVATSITALALGAQAYLSLWLFADATYGDVKIVQLVDNFSPVRLWPFVLYIAVYALALWWAWRFRPNSALFTSILYASLIHLLLWFTLGFADETRIFLPLSLPLAGYAASALLHIATTTEPA